MKYKIVFLITALLTINVVHAQWHFTITSMDYNDNCGGSASIEVSIRAGMAEQQAAKVYNSKEDCELGRGVATMNWSSGGCYIRTTTSPCTGGNIGGGGDIGGGGSTGSGFDGIQNNASLYSNMAIGEPYFSPNEAQATSNLGRDTEIKLEALNNGYNNAVRGIKTGDTSFDDLYKRLSNMASEDTNSGTYTFNNRKEIDPNMSLYVNVKDHERVNLERDNDYNYDDEDIIVPIDPERIKNQERDERLEKGQKEIQHRLDLASDRIQRKLDSILLSNGGKLPNKESKNEDLYGILGEAFFDVASATYGVMTDAVMFSNDGVKMFELFFDVKVPCSERLSDLEDYLVNSKEVFVESLIGNISESVSVIADQIVVKYVEPTSEVIEGMVTTGSNTYTTIINSLSAGNLIIGISKDATKTISETISDEINIVFNGGDTNKPYGRLNRKFFNYARDAAKEIYDRNKVKELIKVKDDEKK